MRGLMTFYKTVLVCGLTADMNTLEIVEQEPWR